MTIRLYTLLGVGPLLFALRGNQDLIVRTNVRMVEVSIVATDGKGKFVSGLEAKDIRVWDNGKEQTIASFRSVSSVTPSTTAALPPGTFSNRTSGSSEIGKEAQPQTLSIVLLDEKNTKFRYQAIVRQAVEKVLGQKAPEQRIALYGLGDRLNALHDFSADKESLLAKLHEYHGELTLYNDLITDFGFTDLADKSQPNKGPRRGNLWVTASISEAVR
jgi:VWFA-related protein